MKNLIALALLALVMAEAGYWLGSRKPSAASAGGEPAQTEREILYWKAPMDPAFRRDEPGKSPMGMDLVPVYADEAEEEPGVVAIDPAVAASLGVRTAPAVYGPLARTIDTVGYVAYDEDTLRQVSTRVAGWIETLGAKSTGEAVSAGQLLFALYSPDLVNAKGEYVAALRSGNRVLQRASRERLAALGVDAAEIARLESQLTVNRLQRIYAGADGIVTQLTAREGSYVTPSMPVMTLGSLDTVWVIAEVFERQSGWVEPGLPVEWQFAHRPGETVQATVDYVYPQLDAMTRTLKVRVRLPNPDHTLRPNLYAHVQITAQPAAPVVHVPRSAVIRGAERDRVVLALGSNRFRSVPVTTGIESGDRVAITAGVSPTDHVVDSAQFLIDSESNIDNALHRMQAEPGTVRVRGVVEGYRIAQRYLTVAHDAVPAWDWPQMSMGFEVADAALLEGLRLGQTVELEIERGADDRYVVTDIEKPQP